MTFDDVTCPQWHVLEVAGQCFACIVDENPVPYDPQRYAWIICQTIVVEVYPIDSIMVRSGNWPDLNPIPGGVGFQ